MRLGRKRRTVPAPVTSATDPEGVVIYLLETHPRAVARILDGYNREQAAELLLILYARATLSHIQWQEVVELCRSRT